MPLPAGTSLGRYEVRSLLGAGGMGEVYLAQDMTLRRAVALKLLPTDFAANSDRLARFEREALAASSLNHPNILTIYEIGAEEGLNFIATEFIEGESLRRHMGRARLELSESLEIGVQVASALAAAHAAGIAHRDIKPENIMLRHDSIVKVLDFGLAKFVEQSSPALDMEALTQALQHNTGAGVVMGTVSYMSPEQARGKEIDARTDIWSLGCVLYEMVAGSVPFAGETTSDVIAAIIHKEALPLMRYAREVPAELERIVTKALQKDRDERYQVVKDLVLDLKSLKRRLDFEEELERSVAPDKPDPVGKQTAAVVLAPKVSTQTGGNRDALLLTEFTNLTGDAVFDGTLKMALAVTLEQSPFLDIFAEARVRQTLRLMGRSPDERVTRELGQEICQRQGLKAYIAGTITSLGTVYVLTLEAVAVQTGEILGRQLEQAEAKEQVLKALGQAASGLREKLGESLSSIERFDTSLEEATTTSLEALKYLSLAEERTLNGEHLEALNFYKRAVELDSNFAYAYCRLGVQYYNTKQPKLAAENITKAFAISDTASELEKLRITFFYYAFATGETDKAIQTAELYKRTYPRDWRASNYLSDRYMAIGQYEKAVIAARDALRLNPNAGVAYENLADSLRCLNRFDEVKETRELMHQRKISSTEIRSLMYQVAIIEGDTAATTEHLAWFSERPNEYVALNLQTGTAALRGQWRRSQDFSRRAIDLASRNEAKGVAAQYAADQALRILFWSSGTGLPNPNEGRLKLALKTHTQHALRLERNKVTLSSAALALSLAGQAAEAHTLTHELSAEYPKDTLISNLWLPLAEAALELQNGQPEETIQSLEPAERFERAGEFYPQYLRGLAHLKLGRGRAALVEFQKIIDHRGEAPLSALYPLAHLGAARAFALLGEVDSSREAFELFFELWKDADADMPLLAAAKSEYERL